MSMVLEQFEYIAKNPYEHVKAWKQEKGVKVVGSFPMHFPAEIVHATGALPMIIQELPNPITSGGGALYPFFCGYTRSVVDQTTEDQLDFLDSIMFSDHCVQLLSAADIIRVSRPEKIIHFHQIIASVRQPWSLDNSTKTLRALAQDLEEVLRVTITEDALRNSISVFNENRQLIRNLYELRRSGKIDVRASQMQHIVKSSMVMDKAAHNAMLRELTAELIAAGGRKSGRVPVYLSGHLCHAPKLEILEMIEECGAEVVDDDLYHGYRYVSTDVKEDLADPMNAIAQAYLDKNSNVPCPTRIDPEADWQDWLLDAVERSKAQGLIVLLAKFCEPHYFAYPRIKKTFEENNVPHLLIETEHEGVAMENLRTKVETFLEIAGQQAQALAQPA
jgi:benzoyl-CoA reductase subunit C